MTLKYFTYNSRLLSMTATISRPKPHKTPDASYPVFWHESASTSTAVGGEAVFYENSSVYDNPIKYTDPDGSKTHALTDKQWSIVQTAIAATVKNLDSMIGQLNDFSAGNSSALTPKMLDAAQTFLGVDFSLPLDASEISRNLESIKDNLSSMTRDDFKYDDKTTAFAITNPFTGSMKLGDEFFNADAGNGNDNQQGVLVHETTHVLKVRGNGDHFGLGYGLKAARELPTNSVWGKANNADNWEFFYEHINNNGSL
jgi:hypothetical protein